MDPMEGPMTEAPTSATISTQLHRIATRAKGRPGVARRTLAQCIDIAFLREAYRRPRKDGAVGVDRQTAEDYATDLEGNLQRLLDRAKSGTYRAPPVRRVYIPKGDGSDRRPIGIPTFEDKILQRAVTMVLEAVYETEFLDSSYGFRPGRSAHQALQVVRDGVMAMRGGWVLEVDIRKFFDTLAHRQLRAILRQRVPDGVLLRRISKWLHAGGLEDGAITYPGAGTPQGGVLSPLWANVFLHEVLATWFEQVVRPRLKGRACRVRYADDVTIVFAREDDARRVWAVLPQRLARYGLTLHATKTRWLQFHPPSGKSDGDRLGPTAGPTTFDMAGLHAFLESFPSRVLGGQAPDRRDPAQPGAPGCGPVGSTASTRPTGLAARGALPQTLRPLRLLWDHGEFGGDQPVSLGSPSPMAEMVEPAWSTIPQAVAAVRTFGATLSAPRGPHDPFDLPSGSEPMI